PMNEHVIQALREALRASPDNLPLRQHLADTLMSLGRPDEAEAEYRQALTLAPDSEAVKVGLARAFYQQDKNSAALVLVEDLLKRNAPPAAAYVLHARLLLRAGEVERAVRQYREALDLDPSSADLELSGRLGVGPGHDQGEVVGGRLVGGGGRERGRRCRAAGRHVQGCRRDGIGQGRDPDEDHPPADAPGVVPGVRQEGRRRHPAVRRAGVWQNASRPRHRGGGP